MIPNLTFVHWLRAVGLVLVLAAAPLVADSPILAKDSDGCSGTVSLDHQNRLVMVAADCGGTCEDVSKTCSIQIDAYYT